MDRRSFLHQGALLLTFPVAAAQPGDAPIHWDPPLELAAGAGLRGPWQQNDSRYDFVDDGTVAFAADGSIVAAWVDQARKAVLVRPFGADARPTGPAVAVDGAPGTFSWIPRVAIASDDPRRVVVLWQEIVFRGGSHGGDMLVAASADGGRTFGAPVDITRSVGGDGKGRIHPSHWDNGSYDLLLGSGGQAVAAWTEYDGLLWIARSADAGRSFEAPRQVAGGRGQRPARAPCMALAPGGDLLLAWTEGDHPSADILLARSADGGRSFSRPVPIASSPHYDDAPSLAVDAAGTVHLAWAESAGGPLRRQRVLVTRSRDGGRTFDAPQALPAPAPFSGAARPTLGTDARGGVYLLCELQDDPRQRPRGLGLALSTDGGARYGGIQLVPGSIDPRGGANGSSQGLLGRKLAVGADGRLLVANSALRQGSHSRVWLLRGRRAA